MNERILRDGCEAVALSGDLPGPVSSPTVDHWMSFVDDPTARAWYRAHNGSVVAGYLEHRDLAEAENAAERFFMNVVLCRVLFAHALVAAPRMSLGWLRPLAPFLGDPRLGMTGIFLQLSRILPDEYPLRDPVATYLDDELGFGRLLDYGVIVPRLQQLYEWSAERADAPGLLDCVRDGALTYAWPFEERDVWRAPNSVFVRVVHRTLPPARRRLTMVDDGGAEAPTDPVGPALPRQPAGEGGRVVRGRAGLRARRDHRPAKRQAAAQRRRHAASKATPVGWSPNTAATPAT